jgi:hypothetical protein
MQGRRDARANRVRTRRGDDRGETEKTGNPSGLFLMFMRVGSCKKDSAAPGLHGEGGILFDEDFLDLRVAR